MGLALMNYIDIVFKLFSAVVIGCIVGADRDLHGKPTGIKTLGLVALGACLATMAGLNFATVDASHDTSSLSRVIEGVITGIGFLGAGVIVHGNNEQVHGLTTAASIWVTAAIGIICGMGDWRIAIIALIFVLMLFFFGRLIERSLHKRWLTQQQDASKREE